jgi:hypothetical protein
VFPRAHLTILRVLAGLFGWVLSCLVDVLDQAGDLIARVVGRAILALAVIDCALVGLGLILTPTTVGGSGHGLLGVVAALVMLAARQEQVLAADQVFEDFKRSGMTDLRAFIMQDYLGGVFFHLLVGLVVAGILGTMGAMTAKLLISQRSIRHGR